MSKKKKRKNKKKKREVHEVSNSVTNAISKENTLQFSPETPNDGLAGSQDYSSDLASYQRRRGLEIVETPIRSPELASELIDMKENSYIVRSTLRQAARDTLSSYDGSDRGCTISPTLADGESPCDPDVIRVATDLLSRRNYDYMVLGGDRSAKGLTESLVAGNGFLELGIEREGIIKNDFCIAQTQYLPTWQIFKDQSDQGQTIAYEQRRSLSDDNPITFPIWKIVDFCHDLDVVYGRSLWHTEESRQAWKYVKQGNEDAGITSHEMATNPNVHTMPENTSRRQRKQYKDSYNQEKKGRMVTDHFLPPGVGLSKLNPTGANTLQPSLENLIHRRIELIPPGVPLFYYPEFSRFLKGARELSNQPAMNYSRLRHYWCSIIAKALRQAIDLELVLCLGLERFSELQKQYKGNMYVIQFPTWSVMDYAERANKPYDDLGKDDENDDTLDGESNNSQRFTSGQNLVRC